MLASVASGVITIITPPHPRKFDPGPAERENRARVPLLERDPALAAARHQPRRRRRAPAAGSCSLAGEAGVGKTALAAPASATAGRPRGPLGRLRRAVHAVAARAADRHRRGHRRRARGARRRAAPRRTRSPRRCCASSPGAARRSSSSRTCTGPTRRRSTCCACSAAASRRVPALVIASYRDDELDRTHPLRITLGELSRRADDRAAAARAAVGGGRRASSRRRTASTPRELYRRTAGNPFFVTEALAAGGVELPGDRPRRRARPRRRRSARRRGRCSTPPRSCPARSSLPLLEALAGDAVGAARGVPVVRRARPRPAPASPSGTSSPGVAVEEALAPHQRLRAAPAGARRAATGRRGASARLAYHAEGAGDGGRGAALRARGGRARRGAPAPTARPRRSTRARCGSPTTSQPAERAELLERRSHECYLDRPARRGDRGSAARARVPPASSATAAARATCCARCRASLWCPGRARRGRARGPRRRRAPRAARARPRARDGLREHGLAGDEPRGRRGDVRLGRAGARAGARRSATEAIELHALNSVGTMEFLAHGPGCARHRPSAASRWPSRPGDVERRRCARTSNLAWAALRHRDYPLAERYLGRGGRVRAATRSSTCGGSTCSATARGSSSTTAAGTEAAETAALVLRERRASPLPVDPRAQR